MRKIIFLFAVFLLPACGSVSNTNISSSSVSSSLSSSSSSSVKIQYYTEIKNIFPDLSLFYNNLCKNRTLTQHVVPIDLNSDGRIDLVLNLWCDLNGQQLTNYPRGSNYTGSIPNSLVVLLQNSDGTYRVGNKEIFGKDFVDIKGCADYKIADLNGDNKQDIIYSVSLEDGRALVDYGNGLNSWSAPPAIMLSQPDGTYSLEILCDLCFANSISIIKGKYKDDFVSGNKRWSYENGHWTSIPNYDWVSKDAFFYDGYAALFNFTNSELVWELRKQDSYGNYYPISKYKFSDASTVTVHDIPTIGDWNMYLVTIGDIDYVAPSFNSFCILDESYNEKIIVGEFQGFQLQERYNGQKLIWYNNISFSNYISRIFAFKIIGETISRIELPDITDSITKGYYVDCVDVNNDKQNDIILYSWGLENEKPYIYLNKGSNGFSLVNLDKLPDVSTSYSGHSTLISDINQDGKAELIYFPLLGFTDNYKGNYDYQVFQSLNLL